MVVREGKKSRATSKVRLEIQKMILLLAELQALRRSRLGWDTWSVRNLWLIQEDPGEESEQRLLFGDRQPTGGSYYHERRPRSKAEVQGGSQNTPGAVVIDAGGASVPENQGGYRSQ